MCGCLTKKITFVIGTLGYLSKAREAIDKMIEIDKSKS